MENKTLPTKEDFEAYRKVQNSGNFNMITEADKAARTAGLDIGTYFEVIRNYNSLAQMYIAEKK